MFPCYYIKRYFASSFSFICSFMAFSLVFIFLIICTDRYFACSLLCYLFVFFHSYFERCFFFHYIKKHRYFVYVISFFHLFVLYVFRLYSNSFITLYHRWFGLFCPFIIAFLLSYIYVSSLSLSTIISISSFLPSIIPSFIHYRMTFQVRHSTIKYFVLSWKIPCFIGSRVTTLTITVSSS